MTKASAVIYPGTFDPLTNGHTDIIARAAKLFDRVVVAVAANSSKAPLFSHAERIHLATEALKPIAHVEVIGFDQLLINLAQQVGIRVILRGLRVVSDFEYEFQLATMNRHVAPLIETMFLTPSEQHMFISSTLVREIAKYHGDVSAFVDPLVVNALKQKLALPSITSEVLHGA